MNVFDELKERGLIAQITNEEKVKDLLLNDKIKFYIGFDPTADSLHVGHFVQIMVMAHMQRAGHTPIALFGGGTAMVGDPSGKSDMRKMMTTETIDHNIACFNKQMSRLVDFSEGKAIMVNNGDWLRNLNYIEFLRDIGVHFSVNRMLAAECYKQRLEGGLTFFEMNYMVMQSYDFLVLARDYDCKMELGGDDQWSNIIGGVELNRKVDSREVYGMTFNLLLTSEGKKMGKTENGAVWLDPEKTSPYDFYQYWRNVDDADVEKCLALLTFLPMDEVRRLGALEGSAINEAKTILAYEVTKLVHGEEEADKAKSAAQALFSGGVDMSNVPTVIVDRSVIGTQLIQVLADNKIVPSKAEGRRLIQQGGLSVNGEKVTGIERTLEEADFNEGSVLIKRGKKNYNKIELA